MRQDFPGHIFVLQEGCRPAMATISLADKGSLSVAGTSSPMMRILKPL